MRVDAGRHEAIDLDAILADLPNEIGDDGRGGHHPHGPGTGRAARGRGPIIPLSTAAPADRQGEERGPDGVTDQLASGQDVSVRLAFRWLKNHFLTALKA
jgi:hypothetical protein